MTLLDRYLLREWLKILGLILCATIGLLLMQALYDEFRDLLEINVGFGEIMTYYAVLMPSYFAIVLPLAMLLSLLFVLGKLHRNNEITAIRAAGLNIFSTTRALWLAGVVACGITLLLNARVVPWSVERARSLKESYRIQAQLKMPMKSAVGMVQSVAFDNNRANRMWYINRYSRIEQKAYGVTVSELDARRREKTRLMAREASYDAAKQQWAFHDGREVWFDVEAAEVMRSVAFKEKIVPHLNEDPKLMLMLSLKPSELSFFELERIVDHFTTEDNPKVTRYAVRYYGLLADTLGPLIILAIAVPFAVSGVRVSPVVGVSKSIGLFFAYYLLTTLASLLGNKGYVDPLWAACLPNLAMIGIGAYLFGRMR
ncbi:MAG: LptF/LptG family permease [Opitutae bacterium]|nr:LptF/LptG family permease [Opitutae bacterium]